MLLDRLTKRAKELLLSLADLEQIKAGEIERSIVKSPGLGKQVLQNLPKLRYNRSKVLEIESVVEEAYYFSMKLNHPYVGTEHLLLGLLKISSSPDIDLVTRELLRINTFPHSKSMNKIKSTPIIDLFGSNKSDFYSNEDNKHPIYRDEVESIIEGLLQKEVTGVFLVGETGVGKSKLVELLVNQIAIMDVPSRLANTTIIEFDLMGFMVSLTNREGIDLGLTALMDELKGLGDVVLYVPNLQNIFVATNVGITVPFVFSMLREELRKADIKILSVMNSSLFDKLSSESDHFLSSFTVVEVAEPEESKCLEIINSEAKRLGKLHGIEIPEEIAEYVYEKSQNEELDHKFPEKGTIILDRACAALILKEDSIPNEYRSLISKNFLLTERLRESLENSDLEEAIKIRKSLKLLNGKITKKSDKIVRSSKLVLTKEDIDLVLLDSFEDTEVKEDSDLTKFSKLADKVKSRIIGQDEAIDKVAKSLIRSKLGLRSKKRPLGNFLFLGPTGVGKTELAKVLAEEAFGKNSLIRLDMSDFGEKHTVARLVGAPPGYVGYGDGGELTQKIEQHPSSVVLFDEIEKAHPDVLNILLQIMEEGELVDARGNTFDFSHAVVVLTSNLGTEILHKGGIGFEDDLKAEKTVEKRLLSNLKKILKPELINRFDELIVFSRLKKTDQLKIIDILVFEVLDRLKEQKVNLKMGVKPKKHLLGLGYSEEYGARSLRRTIERELLDKIAQIILDEKSRPLYLKAVVAEDELVVVFEEKYRRSSKSKRTTNSKNTTSSIKKKPKKS